MSLTNRFSGVVEAIGRLANELSIATPKQGEQRQGKQTICKIDWARLPCIGNLHASVQVNMNDCCLQEYLQVSPGLIYLLREYAL